MSSTSPVLVRGLPPVVSEMLFSRFVAQKVLKRVSVYTNTLSLTFALVATSLGQPTRSTSGSEQICGPHGRLCVPRALCCVCSHAITTTTQLCSDFIARSTRGRCSARASAFSTAATAVVECCTRECIHLISKWCAFWQPGISL